MHRRHPETPTNPPRAADERACWRPWLVPLFVGLASVSILTGGIAFAQPSDNGAVPNGHVASGILLALGMLLTVGLITRALTNGNRRASSRQVLR